MVAQSMFIAARSLRLASRRSFLGAAISIFAFGAPDVLAQRSPRVYRIAVIGRNALAKTWPAMVVADSPDWWDFTKYRESLSERGFVTGRNVELRGYLPKSTAREHVELSIQQAVAWTPDVIKVFSVGDTLLARNATTSIPIVFSRVDDPVSSGLVASMARPGGNVTGVYGNSEDLVLKQLEIAREILERPQKIAVVFDSRSFPGTLGGLAKLHRALAALKIQLTEVDISRHTDGIHGALGELAAKSVDAAIEFGFLQTHVPPNAYREFQRRVQAPYIADSEGAAVTLGAIVGLGPDDAEQIRLAAGLTARILEGQRPAVLPVIAATRYRFVVNKAEARTIGLALPLSILIRADRVIE